MEYIKSPDYGHTTERVYRQVLYSYEYGDKSLPHIKNMVSDKPDSQKSKIIAYLKTHCIMSSPGMIKDIIDPKEIIGFGNIYSDGTYCWDDVFCNYVDKYNIPVPDEFRNHILSNYSSRMKKHIQLKAVDCIEIFNKPCLNFIFNCRICKDGTIVYRNSADCKNEITLHIKSDDARYIIDPILTELFCYDSGKHGEETVDGYHWEITFYNNSSVADEIEGWSNEDEWRHNEIKKVLEFCERLIQRDFGLRYM